MKTIDKDEFEIIAKASTTEYLKLDPGFYTARCISIISLGRQSSTFGDITTFRDEICLEFEVPSKCYAWNEETKKQEWGGGKGSKPFTMRNIYSLSLSEKANLRKDLESWLGKPFVGKNPEFNVASMIGQPAYLVVREKLTQKGEPITRISNILPLPDGITCPPQILENQVLSFHKWNQKTYENLGRWMREKIAQSPDFKTLLHANIAQEVSNEVER